MRARVDAQQLEVLLSATQTEPKPELMKPRLSASGKSATTFGCDDRPLATPAQAAGGDHHGHEQRGAAPTAAAAAGAGIPWRRPASRAPERAAALLALRGLPELQLQPRREVLAHLCLPIRRRAVASPRLTRLRTTASLVCSSPAISP